MSAVYVICTKCGGTCVKRTRAEIADKLTEAVTLSLRAPEEWVRRFHMLTAHLVWLEAELRSRCTNCILAEAAEAFAEISVEVVPVRDELGAGASQSREAATPNVGAGGPCVPGTGPIAKVLPLRRDLGVRFKSRDLSVPEEPKR